MTELKPSYSTVRAWMSLRHDLAVEYLLLGCPPTADFIAAKGGLAATNELRRRKRKYLEEGPPALATQEQSK